ncbi:hypothetical protein [Clostridium sp. UBA1652]|uniref:hypothetical protein n=1 Tax=Clostridium sp. UBA1652 TaxID=1946348 RepID=UPI002579C8EA|nr:hypothetical protein [Clostridium sp. UBA1652]
MALIIKVIDFTIDKQQLATKDYKPIICPYRFAVFIGKEKISPVFEGTLLGLGDTLEQSMEEAIEYIKQFRDRGYVFSILENKTYKEHKIKIQKKLMKRVKA